VLIDIKADPLVMGKMGPSFRLLSQTGYEGDRFMTVNENMEHDIEVRLPVIDQRPDPDIVRDAVSALKLELPFSSENIKVVAREGWLTLEGAVEWNYARERAESAVKNIRGVKGGTNSIEVKPKVAPYEVRSKIEDALRRSAELDASRISVEANGSEVILRSTVRSWTSDRQLSQFARQTLPMLEEHERMVDKLNPNKN
jgi:osmotically-inducible protein OsmY